MKILVADSLPEKTVEDLRALGAQVVYRPDLKAEELPKNVPGVGILIVRGKKVTAETITASDALQMILRAGAGVNTIAVDEASAKGVFVTNCPGKNATAVAELAMGLILALDRRIVDNTADLRGGKWNKREYSKARGLAGCTLGILGMGQIGELVAARARAFEMTVCAWSRSLTPERADELGVEFCNWPRDVARKSDIVSVHVAYSAETRNLVDTAFLGAMKPGSILINTARGGVVDETALAEAVKSMGLRVGLDVYEDEPAGGEGAYKSKLLELTGVIGTHHIGASTDQAQNAVADEAVRIVRSFLVTGEVLNCVNLNENSPARWQLIVRHYNRVGVVAGILDAVRSDNINAEEIMNRIFGGGLAACCSIMLAERPSEAAMNSIRAHKDVIQAELRAVV